MRVQSDMVARAVLAYRNAEVDDPVFRMRRALEHALAPVPEPEDAHLQRLIDEFRRLLHEAKAALEGLQAKLLALTALGAPSASTEIAEAELVDLGGDVVTLQRRNVEGSP